MINVEVSNNIDIIKCLYCDERDENKLLQKTFKNRIICKNCYNIIVDMTRPFRNNSNG